MTPDQLVSACMADLLIGDPRWMPHPVRGMGHVVSWYERLVRGNVSTPRGLRSAGVLLAVSLPLLTYGVALMLMALADALHHVAAWLVVVFLGFTTIAGRDLFHHADAVQHALQAGSVDSARAAVGHIVGRDTEHLSEREIVRATVETIAESTADGVVAPLFYLALGGPPLALAFKAISTLDSMVGHLNLRYRDFGWASARLDDVANWIPARLTGGLFVIAAAVTRSRPGHAWQMLRRDGAKHPSPNSGRPEAALAGALGVQLGGTNSYGGQPSYRSLLGDKQDELNVAHIGKALQLMTVASLIAVVLAASLAAVVP